MMISIGYYVDYLATQMNYVDAWLGMFTELGEMRNASELPITWDSYPDGNFSRKVFVKKCIFLKDTVSTFSIWKTGVRIRSRLATVL